MNNNPSSISVSSISKASKYKEEDFNSNMTLTTLFPNFAKLFFQVKYDNTTFGQLLYIIGSIEELGEWDTSKAIPMETRKGLYPIWTIKKPFTCQLGIEIDYKYLIKDGNKIIWEDLGKNINRHFRVSTPGNLKIEDEKSNNKSTVKTFEPNQNNDENVDSSSNNIEKLLINLDSEIITQKKEPEPVNINIKVSIYVKINK